MITSVASCDLLRWNTISGELSSITRLDAADHDLRLICDAADDAVPKDGSHGWALDYDAPLVLFDVGESCMALIRRAHRSGWTLLELDGDGKRLSRIDLPRELLPLAANADLIVIRRRDLDVPGEPSHLAIHSTDDLRRAGGVHVALGKESIQGTVVRVTPPADLASWAELPLLFVDGKRCVGDIVRELSRARFDGQLTSARYRIAVTDAPTEGAIANLWSVVGREIPLDASMLDWRADVPVASVSLGESIRLLPIPSSSP